MSRFESVMLSALRGGLTGLSYVAPASAGRLATRLWYTPFPLARSQPSKVPPGARRVRYESDGSVVHGYEVGEGPRSALLIHGWAGSSRQYRRIAARLADEGYRCVAIDLPAHGTEAGDSTDVYEIVDAIEVAAAALGSVDLVVAHSLGAMSTAIAMQRSVTTSRVVFVAPGLRPLDALARFAETLRLRPAVIQAIEASMESRFGGDVWDRVPDAIFGMRVPESTLIVHDVGDDMVPIRQAQLLAEQWDVELVSTEGYGHNRVLSASTVIDRIVTLATAEPLPTQ